jgi:hypothetical protein
MHSTTTAGFIDKQKIELVLPFGPAKQPGCPANNTAGVEIARRLRVLHVNYAGVFGVQNIIGLANFKADELTTVSTRGITTRPEKIDHGFMTVRSDSNLFAKDAKEVARVELKKISG